MMLLCLVCGTLHDYNLHVNSTERPKERRLNISSSVCNMDVRTFTVTAQWNSDETGGAINYYNGSYRSTNDEESAIVMFNVTKNFYMIPGTLNCSNTYVFSITASNCAGVSNVATTEINTNPSKWMQVAVSVNVCNLGHVVTLIKILFAFNTTLY